MWRGPLVLCTSAGILGQSAGLGYIGRVSRGIPSSGLCVSVADGNRRGIMTERFSPEYIKFILEASVLQGQWKEPAGGDWCVIDVGYQALVIEKWYENGRLVLGTVEDWGDHKRNDSQYADEVVWLPTLSDLLDMIIQGVRETEWGDWPKRPAEIILGFDWGSQEWYADVMGGHANALLEGQHGEEFFDAELAAATLAVRVLEEGKE